MWNSKTVEVVTAKIHKGNTKVHKGKLDWRAQKKRKSCAVKMNVVLVLDSNNPESKNVLVLDSINLESNKKESRPKNESAPINPITMKTQKYIREMKKQWVYEYFLKKNK